MNWSQLAQDEGQTVLARHAQDLYAEAERIAVRANAGAVSDDYVRNAIAGPMAKNVILGAVLLVLGILCLIPALGMGQAIGAVLETVVAVILIVVGILKLINKM